MTGQLACNVQLDGSSGTEIDLGRSRFIDSRQTNFAASNVAPRDSRNSWTNQTSCQKHVNAVFAPSCRYKTCFSIRPLQLEKWTCQGTSGAWWHEDTKHDPANPSTSFLNFRRSARMRVTFNSGWQWGVAIGGQNETCRPFFREQKVSRQTTPIYTTATPRQFHSSKDNKLKRGRNQSTRLSIAKVVLDNTMPLIQHPGAE
jgi:hypothetical protein